MSVYGDQQAPFNEDMPRKPVDIYAVAKTAMEEATEILSKVHGFEYTIVRPHNVYGPRQIINDPYRNVIGIFMNRVMKGQAPIIYGDGEQTRAFSYIEDVVPYVAACGFQENTKHQIINIGPLEEYSINYLAQVVLAAFHREDLTPVHMEDRPQEVKEAFCTNDKAVKLLGYKTSTPFEVGIQYMANYVQKQGPQPFKYLESLEIEGPNTPKTWTQKLM
jgi:UDP-glucose 4-epimerase